MMQVNKKSEGHVRDADNPSRGSNALCIGV